MMTMLFQQLGLLILILVMAVSGYAEDVKKDKDPFQLLPKDVYFQPGGGLRLRADLLQEGTGGAFSDVEDETQFSHRANLDFRLFKGEYIETFIRLINFAEYGGTAADTNGGQKDGFTRSNGLLVNEAWALWKLDDLIGFKFGRAPLHFGLGFTYGHNDWFNVPYSFDLADFTFDWESAEISFIIAKVQELTRVTNQTLSADPEENHIVINVNINHLFDAFDVINFSLVQVNRDLGSNDGGTTVLNGLNVQRLALEAQITGKRFFGSVFYSYVTGEEKVAQINQVGGIDKLDLKQNAIDIKIGYRFPESNDLRFWVGGHKDSGDPEPGDGRSESYDPHYYEVYGQSGYMDFLRWGNLSFYRLGLDVHLTSQMVLGGEWLEFSKSELADNVNFGQNGRFLGEQVAAGNVILAGDKKLGSEFDVWMDFNFKSGMKIRTTVSSFFPGGAFDGAFTSTGATPSSTISQVLTQVGYSF